MKNITFIGQIDSTYLFGKGRGKDKKKRKISNALRGAGLGLLGGVAGIGPSLLLERNKSLPLRKELIITGVALGAATLVGAGLGSLAFNKKKKK